MATKTVAVCGATGQQGGATVDALLKYGSELTIRGLTRDPTAPKAAALAAKGVQAVKADFDDLDSLKAAFEGCDSVFAVTDFWQACGLDPFKELQQGKNLVDAAKAAGVKHFVFSTLEDTRPIVEGILDTITGPYTVPHFDAKAEIDAYLREQFPGSFTSVYTSIFYQNLLPGGGMDAQKQEDGSLVLFVPAGGQKLAWCSTEDIGGVAAAVIAQGVEKWGGKTVGVVGEILTMQELAETLGKVLGKTVNAVEPPADAWVQALTGFGVPELAAKDLANMFSYYAMPSGNEAFLKLRPLDQTKEIYPEVQGVEDWLTKNKERFAE